MTSEKDSVNRAKTIDKVALGVGAAATIAVAAGLHIARKSGENIRKYLIGDSSKLAKEYWQADVIRDSVQQTRYFHGTEAAVHRRIRLLKCDAYELKKLSESEVQNLKTEKQANLIEL